MESASPVQETENGERKRKMGQNQRKLSSGRSKRKSIVWNFFNPVHRDSEDEPLRCICILCHAVFKTPQSSTTSMRSHLIRRHPEVLNNLEVEVTTLEEDPLYEPSSSRYNSQSVGEIGETEIFEENLITDEEDEEEETASGYSNIYSNSSETMFEDAPQSQNSSQPIVDVENVTRSVAHYIVSNMLPMSSVNNASFQSLVFHLNPSYTSVIEVSEQDLSSRMAEILDSAYVSMKTKISHQLTNHDVSIGLELWVKTNQRVYLLVTCNYIDNWVQRVAYLGMRRLPKISLRSVVSCFEETVSNVLGDILNEYKIGLERVTCIVISTYPLNIDSSLTILSKPTIPCFNYVLRQSYSELIEAVKRVTGVDVIESISNKCMDNLPDFDELTFHPGKILVATNNYLNTSEADLPESVTQNMGTIVHLQDRLNAYVEGSLETPISCSSILPLVAGVDKYFRDTFQAEEESVPDNKWTAQTKQDIATSITESIQSQFKINLRLSSLGDTTLAICSFLDPRYKSLTFLSQEQKQLVHDLVMKLIVTTPEPPSQALVLRNSSSHYTNPYATTGFTTSRLSNLLSVIMTRTPVESVSTEAQREFMGYLAESAPLMDTNPLDWWASSQRKYRNLARVAKKYLCIMGTATDAKFIFTSAGTALHNKMALIESEYVDKIVFLEKHQDILKDEGEESGHSGIANATHSRLQEQDHIIVKVESTTADNEYY